MIKQECIGIPDMILLLMIFCFKKIKIKAEIVLSPGGAYFLHLFTYFENFVILQKYFMILFLFHFFISFYLIFKVILHYSLYGSTTLRSHFELGEILLHFYWLITLMMDGVADRHIFTYMKVSST